ncbi:hypothetical protein SANA_00530 [Gottschalkiaceae bacterium SANA]|nr:hypothetical protein SANA_00530 [Gottschalkiaceae bacterium SANA]
MGKIEVAVGIAIREDGAVLLGQRKESMIHGGKWEFPGGKIEAGEMPSEALIREWKEEVDADLTHIQFWKKLDYSYGDRDLILYLHFCEITSDITAIVHQELRWCHPSDLEEGSVLEADQLIYKALIKRDLFDTDEPAMVEFLHWYRENARDLPWRNTRDPYRIWLSEIMLQQTRVETVIDYYCRFLEKFPLVESLAKAPEEAVMKAWEGLGYYSRARNLHACAKEVTKRGAFPTSKRELLKLPGIGDYTSGAIASFAFLERVPAVDGNVLRVAARWLGIWEDIMKPQTRSGIASLLMERLPKDVATFNQAMMELGATICKPKNPDCNRCPLEGDCYAKWHGELSELPIKSKKKKPKRVEVAVGLIHIGDRLLMVKRPSEGLLAGLWGFPIGEGETQEAAHAALKDYLEEHFDLKVMAGRCGESAEHVFTHRIWMMKTYHFEVSKMPEVAYPVNRVLHASEFDQLAIPTAFQKIIKKGSL